MTYIVHYEKLVERAKFRQLHGYREVHHIIPKCMNGTDDKENLVELTAREHFIAHLLLLKIYPKQYGLIKAVNMMCVESENQHRSMNRMYGWLKEKFSSEMSLTQTGENNSQHNTIWIYSLEERVSKKIPKGCDIPEGWLKGRKFNFDKLTVKEEKKLQAQKKLENDKNEARRLFELYLNSDYGSIRTFVENTNYYDKHFFTLTKFFKKHIETYKLYSQEGTSNKTLLKEKYGGVAQLEER